MSRRSTRLSSDLVAVPSSSSSSTSSLAPRRTSTRSSGTTGSLDALPTTTASRAAGKRNGREMRFSQVLAAEEEEFEFERVGDASAFPHEVLGREGKGKEKQQRDAGSSSATEGTEGKRKRTAGAGEEKERKTSASRRANGAAKAPRPTDGEDWFTREAPSAPPPAAAAAAAPVVLNRTVYAALPDTGETPIIARNKLFRNGGLDSSAGPSSSPSASASAAPSSGGASSSALLGRGAPPIRRGRTSMDLKRARRVSTSFGDGSVAYPHASVPDNALFNHCPVQAPGAKGTQGRTLSEVERMRFLSGCALQRGLEAAAKGEPVGVVQGDKKGKSSKGALAKRDKEALSRVGPTLEEALRQTLRDLDKGNVDIDWRKRPSSNKASGQQTHPQNIVNQATYARLNGVVQAMRSENAAWEEEATSIEAYEAETQRMLAAARAAASGSASGSGSHGAQEEDDVTAPPQDGAWDLNDLSATAKQQLEDARAALAAEAPWAAGAGGTRADAAVRAANAARVAAGLKDERAYAGTELDPRWSQIEYNADQLRHQTHTYANLSAVASRYITTVSARAADALRLQGRQTQRAGPSSSSAAAGTSSETSGAASTQNAQSRNDTEALLGGARKRPLRAAELAEKEQEEKEEAGVGGDTMMAANPDETAGDLLFALVAANSKR